MRGLKRSPGLFGLGVLLVALVVFAGNARADVASDQSGTLIIFPKVIADGSRDTFIQIANTSNNTTAAHCFWINAAGACSVSGAFCDVDAECPPSTTVPPVSQVCVHVCREHNFDIVLSPQQPTIWRVSTGRGVLAQPGLLLGGAILPPPMPFVGELKCFQTDRSGALSPGNALKGEALIVPSLTPPGPRVDFGLISEYNAISVIAGTATGAGGANVLNFVDGQLNPCPAKLIVPHYAEGAIDSFTGAAVTGELSLVACTELLEPQVATYSNANIVSWDEFEQQYSVGLRFGCSVNRTFTNISPVQFSAAVGGDLRKTTVRPQDGFQCFSGSRRCHLCGVFGSTNPDLAETDPQCATEAPNTVVGNCDCTPTDANACPGADPGFGCRQSPGLLGAVEEFYHGVNNTATAAINVYNQGSRPGDVIVLSPNP